MYSGLAVIAMFFASFLPSQSWATAGEQESGFFNSNGVRIHYVDEGAGNTVLLLPVFSTSLEFWETLGIDSTLVATGYRVVAYDGRGHGQSDKPHDPEQYGLHEIEDAVRLLDHLGIERAHVVGYSRGGEIANGLRALHSGRLLSVSLIAYGEGNPFMKSELRSITANALKRGDLGPILRALAPAGQPETSQEQIDTVNRQVRSSNDMEALAAIFRSEPIAISKAELRKNEVPALALIGELDPNKESVDEMAGVMSNLELVVIPNSDHSSAIRHPTFLQELLRFLADHSPDVPQE